MAVEDILNKLNDILADRGQVHGSFLDHAENTQALVKGMRNSGNWNALTDVQRFGLEYIAGKIGRIMTGDPNHLDHWMDIAGYAVLVAHHVKKVDEQEQSV